MSGLWRAGACKRPIVSMSKNSSKSKRSWTWDEIWKRCSDGSSCWQLDKTADDEQTGGMAGTRRHDKDKRRARGRQHTTRDLLEEPVKLRSEVEGARQGTGGLFTIRSTHFKAAEMEPRAIEK